MLKVCMIVKDAGPIIKKVIRSFKNDADSFLFLDTGSTDKTIKYIKNELQNSKYELFEEPFINFCDSRNRCFDLCNKSKFPTKYFFMIDDSFVLNGSLKNELNNDFNIASIFIKTNNLLYPSKRIIKSNSNIAYYGKVHEDIKGDADYVINDAFIEDVKTPQHVERTKNRLISDLNLLKNEESKRNLYYAAITARILYYDNNDVSYKDDFVRSCVKRLMYDDNDYEERFCCLLMLGFENYRNEKYENAYYFFQKAAKEFPSRAGECHFYTYCITGNKDDIKLAFENKLGHHRLPINIDIYKNQIQKYYNIEFSTTYNNQ